MVRGEHKRSQKRVPPNGSFSKTSKFKKFKSRKAENEEGSPYKLSKAKDKDKEITSGGVVSQPKSKKLANQHLGGGIVDKSSVEFGSCAEQLEWFFNAFQAGTGAMLSSLELEEIPEDCMMDLSNTMDHSIQNLSKHVKTMFGPSWKEVLCEESLFEGSVEPGSPAILVISSSAVRCVEVLRGLKTLTTKCHAAKLFAKHIKIEEQVSMLKGRVNIAGGTPSRIKKLIDNDALGLSRLSVVLLDMHKDAKGLTLFTLPQVRGVFGDNGHFESLVFAGFLFVGLFLTSLRLICNEFWELYKTHFHLQVVNGKLRLALY
eukprot:Gb_37210 [translate_table: standard]